MKIRLAHPIQSDSIVDGEGIRTVIWTQGCIHNCKGCHNPETHDPNKGFLIDIEDLKKQIKDLKIQDGITLSGGDPLYQPEACLEIAKYCKSLGMNVWCYTGYTFEALIARGDKTILELLKNIDVLVDGRFILEQKSLNLMFRGSRNQRIIDVPRSLKYKTVYLVKQYKDEKVYKVEPPREKYIFV